MRLWPSRRPAAKRLFQAPSLAWAQGWSGRQAPAPAAECHDDEMILGIGTDLIDIRRIERALERFGERFIGRVFTANERARAERRADRAAAYAKRYAAKEACAKALGTGFRHGVYWRDIGVGNLASGQPILALAGGAAARLAALTPPGMVACVHLSLSDEPPFGQAMVIISAEPRQVRDAGPARCFT